MAKKMKQGRAAPKIKKTAKHKGFKATAKKIASRQGISQERAAKILAAGARKAGAKAQKKNPRLLRVTGVKRKKKKK